MTRRSRSFSFALFAGAALAACVAALSACGSSGATHRHKDPLDPGDDFELGDPPPEEKPMNTIVDDEAGAAVEAPSRRSDKDAAPADPDPADAGSGPKTYCSGPLAPQDLAVVELMVTSRAGSNDDGEWVEIRSTRDCWLSLAGVTIESPRGAATDAVTLDDGVELGPRASFIVADSADPANNHALPGVVFAWNALDVLKNGGDTVRVKLGDTLVDSVTYPSFSNLEPGRALAFPSDCAPGVRGDLTRWSLAFAEWTPGMKGTPNAPNDDVACY
jgi:hypothetical protein